MCSIMHYQAEKRKIELRLISDTGIIRQYFLSSSAIVLASWVAPAFDMAVLHHVVGVIIDIVDFIARVMTILPPRTA